MKSLDFGVGGVGPTEWIVGRFEVLLSMRQHAKQLKLACHGAFRNLGMLCQAAHAPVGAGRRLTLQRLIDHLGDALVVEVAGAAGKQLTVQSFDAKNRYSVAAIYRR